MTPLAPLPRPEHLASAALAGLAGLHLVWATGSPWPLPDRGSFTDAVVGHDAFPPPLACLAPAVALTAGSAFVAGRPRRFPRLSRAGTASVIAVLSLRGVLGLAGRTALISPGSSSPRFRRLDRRRYSPLCLTIAALATPAARARRA